MRVPGRLAGASAFRSPRLAEPRVRPADSAEVRAVPGVGFVGAGEREETGRGEKRGERGKRGSKIFVAVGTRRAPRVACGHRVGEG